MNNLSNRYYKGVVFLDRDGTINEDKNGYTYKIEDFNFIEGAWQGIGKLISNYYKVIVVTNQSGIDKGYFTEEDLEKFNRHLMNELIKRNIFLENIYYCPFNSGPSRKPNSGMFTSALDDLELVYNRNRYVIGDRLTDLEAGDKVGCKKILVKTGHGQVEYKKIKKLSHTPDYYAVNLNDAANWIIKNDVNTNDNNNFNKNRFNNLGE